MEEESFEEALDAGAREAITYLRRMLADTSSGYRPDVAQFLIRMKIAADAGTEDVEYMEDEEADE